MTEFEERLQKAIERGKRRGDAAAAQERAKKMSAEELKRLHTKLRLQISEHIESCIKKIPEHFPGFRLETLYGERGWGAACYRDDMTAEAQRRNNLYTRFELAVRPYSEYNVIDLAAKGTIQNKEIFKRAYFEDIIEADVDRFNELVDVWILEFAELYSASI